MATATDEKKAGGLVVIPAKNFISLNQGGEMAEAMAAMGETGETLSPSDLIRVPTPSGGGTTWTIPNPVKEEETKEISGIWVYYQRCGVLWPSEEPSEGAMPVLRTFDLKIAEQVGPIPDEMVDDLEPCRLDERHYDWEKLPQNQWGTGKGGVGKLCKEQRMLFILRQQDMFPLLVTCQPGSLKPVTKFFKMLPTVAKVPYYRCVVSLTLQKMQSAGKQPYSQIVPSLTGTINAEDGLAVRKMWTDQLATIARQVDISSDAE